MSLPPSRKTASCCSRARMLILCTDVSSIELLGVASSPRQSYQLGQSGARKEAVPVVKYCR
jgi:hypothetical protein